MLGKKYTETLETINYNYIKMKKLLFLIILLVSFNLKGQILSYGEISFDGYHYQIQKQKSNLNRTSTCTDTIEYALSKATDSIKGIIIEPSYQNGIGQYFDCPQPINLYGMEFYAAAVGSNPTAQCVVKVYKAGSDSLPNGPAIDSVKVIIDSSSSTLNDTKNIALFSTPVYIDSAYIITVTLDSNQDIFVAINDYKVKDGANENLVRVKLNNDWYKGLSLMIDTFLFDADVLFSPIASYNLSANFSYNNYCIPGTVSITNNSSPIIGNRMYNTHSYNDNDSLSYSWDFGDGSPKEFAINPNHNYTNSGPFNITLADTLLGWKSVCTIDTSLIIDGRIATPRFQDSIVGLIAYFTDTTNHYLDTHTSWLWDFGDGNLSILQNPTHVYLSSGTYMVCFTATGACGTDSSCRYISTNTVGLTQLKEESIFIFPNPANNQLTIEYSGENLTITDILSREIKTINLSQGKVIDISELKPSTYFLRSEDGKILTRFIKQ